MDLESDNGIVSYTDTNVKEKLKKEEKSSTTKHKKITTIKDKNMLKLMQKWKKVEDSLNNSDNEREEKLERWAEEQKNKVDSNENPNFQPISGNWREKILKRKELQNS